MSATARATASHPRRQRPAPRAAPPPARRRAPSLREVPAPRATVAKRGVFSVMVVALLLGGMVMLLGLNTSLASGAFEISSLTSGQSSLAVQEQYLIQKVALAESPEALQKRAVSLGMVPASSPVFIRLADGAILGVPTPSRSIASPAPHRTIVATSDSATLDGTTSATDTPP